MRLIQAFNDGGLDQNQSSLLKKISIQQTVPISNLDIKTYFAWPIATPSYAR